MKNILVSSALATSLLFGACSTLIKRDYRFHVDKDRLYKTVDGIELKGDFYVPEEITGLKPAVVVVHGGGWTSRSGLMHQICSDLAGAGFVVFNITYRLAPEHHFPDAVDDVRHAIQYLVKNAAQYQVDVNRISGWGYSAGANLILLAGLDPKAHLNAIVSGGTPADLPYWPDSPLVYQFIGYPLTERRDLWEAASPIQHIVKNSPPVFLYHGEWDHLVEIEQMYKMRDALQAKGVKVQTHAVKMLGHIAVYLFSGESVRLGIEFLKAQAPLTGALK